jgi:hypothetical protein
VAVNYHTITTLTAFNPMAYGHLVNMEHAYTHISTQKHAAFDSKVLFGLLFGIWLFLLAYRPEMYLKKKKYFS